MTKRFLVSVLGMAAGGVLACAQLDVIPTADYHPANPEAPVGPIGAGLEEAPTPDAGAMADHDMGEMEGMDHNDGAKGDKAKPDKAPKVAAAELAAYERAKPVFEKHCAKCHASSGAKSSAKKRGHFDMDTYPFGGHHVNEMGKVIREVLGAGGEEATMPMDDPGAVKGAELEAVIAWSKAFDAARASGGKDDGDGKKQGGHGGHD